MTKKTGKKITDKSYRTPPFRVAWPYLIDPDEDGKRSVKMIFDDTATDYTFIENEFKRVAKEAKLDYAKLSDNKKCLRETPENQIEWYGENTHVMSANSNFEIAVVDSSLGAVTDQSQIVPGSYAMAVVEPAAYSFKDKKGVTHKGVKLYLTAVQLLGGGKAFSSKKKIDPTELFDSHESLGATLPDDELDDGDW